MSVEETVVASRSNVVSRLRAPTKALMYELMKLHVLPAGPIQTNAYLLTDTDRGEAILIDAPDEVWAQVEPLLTAAKCQLKQLWLTHGHWDHTQGGAEVVRQSRCSVVAHSADRVLIETPEIMEKFMGETLHLEAIKVDRWIEHGETVPAIGRAVELRHVPGHCPGNVLFYFADVGAAFVGDALFAGSIGRTDLPGGDFAVLERSIRDQIYTLPADTQIFPGHGPATTVERERATNPYVNG
jgi:hydroxyacylglutathione hydrolase